jgi:hypothetical protein
MIVLNGRMTDEFKRLWKEVVVTYLRYYLIISLKLREVCHNNRFLAETWAVPWWYIGINNRVSECAVSRDSDSERSEFECRWSHEFSLLHVVQSGSGVHPNSYLMNTGALSPGIKRPVREADHSPPASAEIKKMWIYTSTPPYAYMA